jgi:hypothetical protein
MTLPHKVQLKDCIVEGGQFGIECPLEIDHSDALITFLNAVYSAELERPWLLPLPCVIFVLHTIFGLGAYYL